MATRKSRGKVRKEENRLMEKRQTFEKRLHQEVNRHVNLYINGRDSFGTKSDMMAVVSQAIRRKLSEAFKPKYLDVINESYMHNVPKGSETHFKVIVVSDLFEKKPLIQRHRMVNEVLVEELKSGVHALSIQAKTPDQWEESGHKVAESPRCLGGGAR